MKCKLDDALDLLCKAAIGRLRQDRKGRGVSRFLINQDISTVVMADKRELQMIRNTPPLTKKELSKFSIESHTNLLSKIRGETLAAIKDTKAVKAARRKYREE